MCAERWTLQYYKSSQYITREQGDQDACDDGNLFHASMVTKTRQHAVLSQNEKFRKASCVAQKLASLISEVSMEEFNLRLAKLEEIMNIWARGGRLSVIECCDYKEGL